MVSVRRLVVIAAVLVLVLFMAGCTRFWQAYRNAPSSPSTPSATYHEHDREHRDHDRHHDGGDHHRHNHDHDRDDDHHHR